MITLDYRLSEAAQRAELAAGRPAHQDRTVDLTPTPVLATLATIGPDGQATITRHQTWMDGTYIDHLAAEVLTAETAPAWIASEDARAAAAMAEVRARAEAKRTSEIARSLSIAVDDVYDHRGEYLPGPAHGMSDPPPQVRAHLDAIHAIGRARREAATTQHQAEEAAAKEAVEAMESAARLWCIVHATEVMHDAILARAASEGRAVRGRLATLATAALEAALDDIAMVLSMAHPGVPSETVTYHAGTEPREGVPSAVAYQLLDTLRAAVPGLALTAGLPGAEILISDVIRVDVSPARSPIWRTGVAVTLRHPWISGYTWALLAEPE